MAATDPPDRLATYGTLSPGRPNHHLLADLRGRWLEGKVRGTLLESGWGAALGYPGLVLDPGGPEVAVHVLESVDLGGQWPRLDAFEGPGYRRVLTTIETVDGPIEAWIYELAPQAG
jgi:gamma-glutamylcyclotransferase (GGCT)/AIG2-like uncharacterized protein YtfP